MSPDRHRSASLPAWALGLGLLAAIGVVVLNIASASLGMASPALYATDVVVDLAVLGITIFTAVRVAMRADAEAARMRAALDETSEQLGAIVDSAMDAIVSVDERYRIVLLNRAAEQLFGLSRDEALGSDLGRLIPARFRGAHPGHLKRFAETGQTARRMGEHATLWALRADGTEVPIEASISRTGTPGARLFTVILRDITRRIEAAETMRRQQQEMSELSARVLEAREEEKTLIARELHDELGQLLTALKMDLAWMRARLPAAEAALAEKGEQMNALLDQTVGSVRRISAELRPLMLDDLGLADAAGWLVEDFARRSGVQCRFDQPSADDLTDVARATATAVYRALQESLTNIARHAQASHAWVVLSIVDGMVTLEVEDDGRGITADDLTRDRSLGLKGMRERARHLGGSLSIDRAPRGGTRIRMQVPARSAAAAEPVRS